MMQLKTTSLLLWAMLCMTFAPSATAQTIDSTKTDVGQHPWNKKKIAYLGDSITDPRHKGAVKKYWSWINDWLDTEAYVYGVSGRQWNDIPRQTERLLAEHGQDIDAIIVFVGTNDFNHSVPIGEWWDETTENVEAADKNGRTITTRKKRTPNTNDKTYRGRINIAIEKIKKAYPTKQIVLLTPLHRGYATFSEQNIQPAECYQNLSGEWIDSYVESVIEAGRIWSVPVIDWNATSGLQPIIEEQRIYFKDSSTDQLHPNDLGHRRLAQTLVYALRTIPCTF